MPGSGMLPPPLGWHKVVPARRAAGNSQGREPRPQCGQGTCQHSGITTPKPPKSPPLGHPGPELLSGHGGAERCGRCSPCWPAGRAPATGRDTRARRNLPTTTSTGSTTSPLPASAPLPDPPALAAPVSPQQRLTRSSITTALRRGVKVPQRPMGAPKPMLLGGPKANAHPSVGLLGWQPRGTAGQEQERRLLGMPDTAGRSHRVPPHQRHRPPPKCGGFSGTGGCARLGGCSGSL